MAGASIMNIQIHIERLVLEGIDVSYVARPTLQMAVEAELTRLLAAGGLAADLQTGGSHPAIFTCPIQLTGDGPTHLGQQIAQAVYGGLNQ
jgi:hypothetical protein